MRIRRLGATALLGLVAVLVSLVAAAPAQADIHNPPGYTHLKVTESGQCLELDNFVGAIQQWTCVNAASEEWRTIGVSAVGGPITHILIVSHLTSECLAVPFTPTNGTRLVMLPCDVNDVRQFWNTLVMTNPGEDRATYHVISLLSALCLAGPDHNSTVGAPVAMRTCGDRNTHTIGDNHEEQWWDFV